MPHSSSKNVSGENDHALMLREMLIANPNQLANLKQSNPSLAEAVLSGSLGMYSMVSI